MFGQLPTEKHVNYLTTLQHALFLKRLGLIKAKLHPLNY